MTKSNKGEEETVAGLRRGGETRVLSLRGMSSINICGGDRGRVCLLGTKPRGVEEFTKSTKSRIH